MDDVQENQIEKTTTTTITAAAVAATQNRERESEKRSQKDDMNCNIMADERVSENERSEEKTYKPSACMHANHIMGFRICSLYF